MVNSFLKNQGVAALVMIPVFAVSACGVATRPALTLLPAAEAGPKYQQLSTEISEVLSTEYPGLEWAPVENQHTRMAENNDGECILSIGTLRSQQHLSGLAGEWEPVMDTIAPILKNAGFSPVIDTDSLKGGWTGISSQDHHGGEIRINEKNTSNIHVSAKVSDEDCTGELGG
ncbi:hypothetical protein AS189_17355 [Arthrobacter alpinus]|uniref:Lipoprotein n=1 Tax=Arthrobacter alpinus TaxID=656366 RepID=A0A0S2M2U3_9MICC|nr:hypothetical protein [Arthrobacter alpinus]ALO67926.1 hypothetical protein AS189_17355 [Arthrobacter alpinus]